MFGYTNHPFKSTISEPVVHTCSVDPRVFSRPDQAVRAGTKSRQLLWEVVS